MKGFRVVKESASGNHYCGPAALSIITGRSVEEICRLMRIQVTGQRAIKGLHGWQVVRGLALLGYHAAGIPVASSWLDFNRPTLAAWLRRQRKPEDVYLVGVTGHWIVVRGRKIADNHNPNGVFLRRYQHRRRRVLKAWLITKRAPLGERAL